MAMALASPAASPSPVSPQENAGAQGTNDTTNDTTTGTTTTNGTPSNNNNTTTNATNGATTPAPAAKRKPSRRANTAERRATHNAVERQRRETLNGRFLDLAALLPNLSQIRRPSKSSIVNSSIAYIHASRRHRQLASRELRLLKTEADALRRELNEWRDRSGLPRVEENVRSEAFAIVASGELDVLVAEMGAEMAANGHGAGLMDEDEDDDWGNAAPSAPSAAYGGGAYEDVGFAGPHHHGMNVGGMPGHMMHGAHAHPYPHPQQQQQQQQQQLPFTYQPPQQIPFGAGHPMDDERYVKNANPFAHNVPRGSYDGPQTQQALFTPPATRDGLPPPPANSTTTNGGASPAHSARSAHSAASPVSSHGHGTTPPPMSAVSVQGGVQRFSGRSGSGSPVNFSGSAGSPSYELSSGPGGERRSSYPPTGTNGGARPAPQRANTAGSPNPNGGLVPVGVDLGMGGMIGYEMNGYAMGGHGHGHGHGHGGHHAHGGGHGGGHHGHPGHGGHMAGMNAGMVGAAGGGGGLYSMML